MTAPRENPTPTALALADALLDAQVQFMLAEFTGERLLEVVDRDVRELLTIAEHHRLDEVVDRTAVQETVWMIADLAVGSKLVEESVAVIADAIHDNPANDDYALETVVDREPISDLFAKILSMHATHERGLERLTDSPLFAGVVASFVNKLVADMIAQNRQIAEKLPGMGSLFSLGMGAASKMKGVSDQFLGDVAGKGAQFALRRTNSAILDVLRTAPVHDAAMQLWDVHADAPVGSLREYIDRADFAELAAIGYRLVASGRNTEFSRTLLDACVEAFFDRYGEHTIADLLPELGLSTDLLVAEVQRYAPGIVAAVEADGVLERLVRSRLEPFYHSDRVLGLLGSTA